MRVFIRTTSVYEIMKLFVDILPKLEKLKTFSLEFIK